MPETPEPGSDPDPEMVAALGEYLHWHARHEDQHGGNLSGTDYWQGVARGVLNGLNNHGMVALSTADHEKLLARNRDVSLQLDAAFGAGYQQCRDELATVFDRVPDGGHIEAHAVLEALDTDAGLQFETRDARIRRYNEALRFLLDPDNVIWFDHHEPQLMQRLRTALTKEAT